MGQIEYIIGNEDLLKKMPKIRAWKPFDVRVIQFCATLAENLMKEKEYRLYPDLVSLAFWLRKSNLQKIAHQYQDLADCLGRGLVFHIAPGNVALSFAYSLATGLLTGNTNIIRLPSRDFEQADIFCHVLRNALMEEPELATRICLIKYPHDKAITDDLSSKCHTRIIWGGDDTINVIRQSPIPPRATEITFANRFSICLIDADNYLSMYDPRKTAHDFYIDTYLSDQNACSSPRILFWMGKNKDTAKERFWGALYDEIHGYHMASVTTVDKLLTFCKFAAENKCRLRTGPDYRIMRVGVESLGQMLLDNIGNSGYFYEYDIADASEILPVCTWECQTLSYIGVDGAKLRELMLANAPVGVDRIAPVGHTMDFHLIWDGRDIVREMTRRISLQ